MKVVSFLCFACFSLALFAGKIAPDSISYYMKDGQRIIIYEVNEGETLFSISKNYNTSIDDILALNPSIKDRQVRKGQIIKIPVRTGKERSVKEASGKRIVHTVQKGETLFAISRKYGVSVEKIISANNGLQPENLKPRQQIKIPQMGPPEDDDGEIASSKNDGKKVGDKEKGKPKHTFPTRSGKKEKQKYRYHEVVPGETVYGISRKYDVMVTDLMDWNQLENFNIDVGQKLIVGQMDDMGKEEVRAEKAEREQDSEREKDAEREAAGESFAGDNDQRKDHEQAPAKQEEPVEIAAPVDTARDNERDYKDDRAEKQARKDRRKGRNDNYTPRETLISLEYKEHLSVDGYKELTEKAIARWMKNVEGYPVNNGYFALHKTLPIGTIIKVANPVNQRVVFAKVIGHLPGGGNHKDIQVKLPEAAAKELKAFDDTSMLQISYLQEQNGH